MKMTVREAFKKYEDIAIDFIWITKCYVCGKYFDELDDEYSFDGDLEYFTGDWNREYGVIDLDDVIEQYEGDNRKFKLYRDSAEDGLCDKCEYNEEPYT